MRVVLKDEVLVLIPETGEEELDAGIVLEGHEHDVYELLRSGEASIALRNLGPRPEACREPINIVSTIADERWQLISNFAHTPFVLDGRTYGSVEAFWQSLKFPKDSDRRRIAPLHGGAARNSAEGVAAPATVLYEGVEIAFGRPEHWALMRRACEAKFAQDADARDALLSTGTRPLTHRVRRDSRSIPGAIMSEIWMDIRERLRT
jgi:hypothetical protein